MRLINTRTLQFQTFETSPPPYAILSHTWGPEEVTFEDFHNVERRRTRAGYTKIQMTCEQARKHGLDHAWVDTCCIDKSSSAELSEAINSMFAWYRDSAVCYAYLDDVQHFAGSVGTRDLSRQFRRSRWFTRGFTLQELIAPPHLEFYTRKWHRIGKKGDLASTLTSITNVDATVLLGGPLRDICVAKRMSWAAYRETTREEDKAYCLMGIFEVNMPLLYGEGPKAFIRLQENILMQKDDHSLFAWRASTQSSLDSPYRGIFAHAPREFAHYQPIAPFLSFRSDTVPSSITNRGIPLTLTFQSELDYRKTGEVVTAALDCTWGDDYGSCVAIDLVCLGGNQFARTQPSRLSMAPLHGHQETVYLVGSMYASSLAAAARAEGDDVEMHDAFYIRTLPPEFTTVRTYPDVDDNDNRKGGDNKNSSNNRLVSRSRIIEVHRCIRAKDSDGDGAAVAILFNCGWHLPRGSRHLLLLLWADRVGGNHGPRHYYYHYDVLATPADETVDRMVTAAKKPLAGSHVNGITVKTDEQTIEVRGSMAKIRGYDMFCIDIVPQGDPAEEIGISTHFHEYLNDAEIMDITDF